jgi:hypothetical protein
MLRPSRGWMSTFDLHMCIYALPHRAPALERGDTPSGTVPNVAPKLPCMQDVSNVTHDAVAILELYVVIIREGVIMALR